MKKKVAPSFGLALRPNTASVSLHDARDGRKPDAGAFKLLLRMEPMERSEESLRMFHIESGAVVPHVERQ